MSEATDILSTVSDRGLYALRECICNGEEYRQKNNGVHLSPKRCDLPYSSRRSGITESTIKMLARKGLVERTYPDHLTALGLRVARAHMDVWLHEDDNGNFEDGHVATTVESYVKHYLKLRQDEDDKREAELKHAKHLFRGIKVRTFSGRRAFSTLLDEQFSGGTRLHPLRMNLDELADLGEQIEKLRCE